jgi:hypothetical protein
MELVFDSNVVPHRIFAEATSIEHFVELLQGYHAELMANRPAEHRYELEVYPPQLQVYSPDHPDNYSDTTWGEYSFRLKLKMPLREGRPFETFGKDFPFLQTTSSQGTGGAGKVHGVDELHGVYHDLECFPKIHAQFMALQDLNAKHAKHVYEMDRKTQDAFTEDEALGAIRSKLNSHRVAVYLLESEEQTLMKNIRAGVNASHPEPYAAEREALLQKFQSV